MPQMLKPLLIAAVCVVTLSATSIEAQDRLVRDYFRDYVHLNPRSYSPDDPWTMGRILRIQVGHGGFFYNCDYEECKRQSPYINWNCQNGDCQAARPVRSVINQQLEEIKQRVRWGSCNECGAAQGSCECVNCMSGYAESMPPAATQPTNQQVAEALWKPEQKITPASNENNSATQVALAGSRTQSQLDRVADRVRAARMRTIEGGQNVVANATANSNATQSEESSRALVARLLQQSKTRETATADTTAPDRTVAQAVARRASAVRKATARNVTATTTAAEATEPATPARQGFLAKMLAPPARHQANRAVGEVASESADATAEPKFRMLRR